MLPKKTSENLPVPITGAKKSAVEKYFEDNEDEFIEKLRMTSLLWAVFVNYILLLVSFLFIYGTAFLNVMIYNMFTVLIIFIARFNYILYQNRKSVEYEEHH